MVSHKFSIYLEFLLPEHIFIALKEFVVGGSSFSDFFSCKISGCNGPFAKITKHVSGDDFTHAKNVPGVPPCAWRSQ